jgi:hypothetical protein
MRRVALLASVAWVAALGLPSNARAEDPCRTTLVASTSLGGESGVGGTGHTSESGIGGTGHSGESGIGGTGHSGESGIGGTGLSGESGIGGTGLHVYGTLNGFGSLCVNGLRVVYDADVAVQLDGRDRADAEALAVGQVLWIEAERREDTLHAKSIRIVEALTGRIESLDRQRHALRVNGHTVDVSQAATYGDGLTLAVGGNVTVFGLWQGDTHIVATRIVSAPGAAPRVGARLADLLRTAVPGATVSLEGYVASRLAPERLRVAGLEIDVARTPALDRPVRVGDRVRATGALSADRVLRVAPPRPPTRPTPVERPLPKDKDRNGRPPVVDRPPTIEKPPVIEKPPLIDRIDTPPRIETR